VRGGAVFQHMGLQLIGQDELQGHGADVVAVDDEDALALHGALGVDSDLHGALLLWRTSA
jgi:hypothetical protein